MPLYPFGANDIFYNRIKTHPKSDFWIYNRKIYYNNKGVDAGSFHSQSLHVQPGFVSLYEMNVDRSQNVAGQMIYPFITKDSGISAFKTVSTNDFNSGYLYGEQIAGRYPLSASIAIEDRKDTTLGHDIRADLTSGRPHILALKNINRLEALVTDLVDISRIETGELTMNIDRVNILPIIEELVSDANENNDNKDISIFITNKDSQEINVQADPDRIHQVFDNLISNAIRYTDSGEIEIAIIRKADRVNFSINDTGIGIDNEALERIFERFYRTLTARSRVRSGTGLGLSIVKHIIEAHESNIEVKSVLGKGTTFSFELNLDHD